MNNENILNPDSKIFTVSEITANIKQILKDAFPNIYIKGEISRAEMNKLIELNRTKIRDNIEMNKEALTLDTALQAAVKNGVVLK